VEGEVGGGEEAFVQSHGGIVESSEKVGDSEGGGSGGLLEGGHRDYIGGAPQGEGFHEPLKERPAGA